MTDSAYKALRQHILDCVSNDFECLQVIVDETKEWMRAEGVIIHEGEVIEELGNLIEQSLVDIYELSPTAPAQRLSRVAFDKTTDGVYYFLSDAGRRIQAEVARENG